MLIATVIIILIVSLQIRKNTQSSSVFTAFFAITLASAVAVLISIFAIGGWTGIGVGMIAAPIHPFLPSTFNNFPFLWHKKDWSRNRKE